ncbi:IclR family transcriptional regulator [Falsiroseomonas sp.]|uniref:IclR family transcriptional regulator n=1 Tax=Falsiroseomonas sp. TaxID=2870721 RepID=UPI003569A162
MVGLTQIVTDTGKNADEGRRHRGRAGDAQGRQARDASYQVEVVQRALQLLTLVADAPSLSLAELARRSGLTKARAFRLLHTLEASGFVLHQDGEPGFRLGYQALRVGARAGEQLDVVRVARPIVELIGQRCDETVQLRVRDGLHSVCVCRWETSKPVRYHTEVGRRVPLHAGSGRLLLAFAPADVQRSVLASPLEAFTSATPSSPDRVGRDLAVIRKQGFCVTQGELEPGAISASVPVRDAAGEVVAAFIVAAPIARIGPLRASELIAWAREGAALVTTSLGGSAGR